MYNFHAIAVHFPIAFLTLYAVLELIPFRRFREWHHLFYIKGTLVILGALAAWGGVVTGSMLTGFKILSGLVGLHQKFAFASALLFSLLAVVYLITWLGRSMNFKPQLATSAENFLRSFWTPLLALIGLVLLTLTGALGGAMTFGPNAEPWTPIILRLFGVSV